MPTSLPSETTTYHVIGHTPDEQPYSGHVTITPDGQAWQLHWTLTNDTTGTTHYRGIAFTHDSITVITRAPHPPSLDNPDTTPGNVIYDITTPGTLPAHWYHPSLNGTPGEGVSTHGPTTALAGTYDADYASSDGENFDPLTKTITPLSTDPRDKRWELTWVNNAGQTQFNGIAIIHHNEQRLLAGWASPPRYDLEHGHLTPPADQPNGFTWWNQTKSLPGPGREQWSPAKLT